MTINHEHKLPELSVIPTEELDILRAALVENARQINRLKEDNESWKRENDAIPPVGYQVGENFRLRRANEQRDRDIEDLRERLANRDREVADLKAGRTADAATICNYQDSVVKQSARIDELRHKLSGAVSFSDTWKKRAHQAESREATLRIEQEAMQRAMTSLKAMKDNSHLMQRVMDAERLASERQGFIHEMERNAIFGHQCWLQGQLEGPGLALPPGGTYAMQSNFDNRLIIKRTS